MLVLFETFLNKKIVPKKKKLVLVNLFWSGVKEDKTLSEKLKKELL